MNAPFIFVSTNRIKQGQRDAYREYLADFVPYVEEREPDLLAFYVYLDEDGEHVSGVQIHRNPTSMLNHGRIAREHIGEAYADYLEETVSIQIFGEPSDELLAMIEQLASDGTPVSVNRPFNGFHRLVQPHALDGHPLRAPTIAVFEYDVPFPATAVFGFEPTASGGTRMSCRTELRPRDFDRLLAPLIAREAAATDEAQFKKVKATLEARDNSPLST